MESREKDFLVQIDDMINEFVGKVFTKDKNILFQMGERYL